MLGDGGSHPGDRLAAVRGLLSCSLAAGDLPGARRFAEKAAAIAEPMGDDASSKALSDLTEAALAQGDMAVARATSERLFRLAGTSSRPSPTPRRWTGLAGATSTAPCSTTSAPGSLLVGTKMVD